MCSHNLPESALPFHLLCDNTTPMDCTHCQPKPSHLCCDLCNSSNFEDLTAATIPKPARAPVKSNVKPYKMVNGDHKLKQAILDWQKQWMITMFGLILTWKYGANYLLPDDLVQRIIDCVHASKLISVESLKRETHWTGAKEHGPSLLELIHLHTPLCPPLPTVPAGGLPLQKNSLGVPMPKKQQCRKCKQEGHIGTLNFHHFIVISLRYWFVRIKSSLPCQYRCCAITMRWEHPLLASRWYLHFFPYSRIWIEITPVRAFHITTKYRSISDV